MAITSPISYLYHSLTKISPRTAHLTLISIVMISTLVMAKALSQMLDGFQSIVGLSTATTATVSLIDLFTKHAINMGFNQDWFLTRSLGIILVSITTILAFVAISFSAVFQLLCLTFIMRKKWNNIYAFLTHIAKEEEW